MPAPSIATLYDFETAFENATANYFTNVNANWQVLTPRSNILAAAHLLTPRVVIDFAITGTDDQREISNGVEYYSGRSGTVTIQAIVQRNNTLQSISGMRGTIRQAFFNPASLYNANTLPYYQTWDAWEISSGQGVSDENDEIMAHLTFGVKFGFLPTAFP